jgi:hypothetical protein
MRKLLLFVAALTAAVMAALPLTMASAATPHVLTINKVGGPAVKVGAILKANLKVNTKAKFVNPSNTAQGVFCNRASLTNKVIKNPLKPGTAVESLTAQTFSKCTTSGLAGATVNKVVVRNLPYTTKVSDAKGFPITVTKPGSVLKTSITITALGQTFTCTYKKTTLKGNASNVGNVNIFKNQVFVLSAGPSTLCLAKGSFSATFGPLKDFSVGTATTHPKVFVN